MPTKPLSGKAYGSIGHMPGSRTGSSDWTIHAGQFRIGTEKARDKRDRIIVTEKLDGSCCAVANVEGVTVALNRAGYLATSSPYELHHMFAEWVAQNAERFAMLPIGARMVGEWLAVAHGTRYILPGEPFVPFDVMRGKERYPHDAARILFSAAGLPGAAVLHDGGPLPLEDALARLGRYGLHGAQDDAEGVVYRVERDGACDFLMKYVRPGKVDGKYLPEISGQPALVLWPAVPA